MRVTVVGSGTVHPFPRRVQSCVVVEVGGETLVFDLGYGAVHGMLDGGLDPFAVDRIFFTHFHPDHTSDIVPLLFSANYGLDKPRGKPLQLAGPEPFLRFWNSVLLSWGEWMSPEGFNLTTEELPPVCREPLHLPGATLSWAKTEHRPESIAYRLDASDGGSFVYTGDTEYCESVVALAEGADTLLVECSAPDDSPIPGHLTPSGVARIASEAGVRRVVLTHVFPKALDRDPGAAVRRSFGGEVILAADGLSFRA
ncbi:MBL fold metallo-hydrolase [Rubrobacter indicoceani]|uniref:MBL fold metallo-hydrolase n=1 Tax=Rubrobacter indicoceani TaxID=2051957 RepID=UPI0013C46260|nr:MBL fold metallo-hydrolase [Rubrobacter indicoceani]